MGMGIVLYGPSTALGAGICSEYLFLVLIFELIISSVYKRIACFTFDFWHLHKYSFSNLSNVYQEETEYFRFVIVYLNGFLNLLIYDIMCK